jgi:phosphoglucosamine mutase
VGRIFGTDGIRGRANDALTPELAVRLGRGLVTLLAEEGTARPTVLIGRDPRWSGEMLEAALVAGITSAGGDAVLLGVLPTAGGAAAGAVISASHNPVGDNGIKFFGPDGFKLTDAEEERFEDLLDDDGGLRRPTGADVGRAIVDTSAVVRYVDHVVETAEVELTGMTLVVDGANGAASEVAPQVYRRLGAVVHALHCEPDGRNINDGVGSTHPEVVRRATVELGADVGIAHDGDADRLIAASGSGEEVDGDVILAILARHLHGTGRLARDTVVTTVMTNLGFRRAMQGLGIDVVETKVGDRYVLEAMRDRGLNLGGEQSGHLIALDHATTGDGVLSAVQLLATIRATGASLDELAGIMTRLPQTLHNVDGVDRSRLDGCTEVWDAVAAEETRLGDAGRVLVRPSGTEPLVRVMVEAPTPEDAEDSARRIAEVVRATLSV